MEPRIQFSQCYTRFADVYDTLMQDVDYDAWAAYLDALLRLVSVRANKAGRITLADCACGTGALSVRLTRLGYVVTGVDNAPDMLRIAGDKARKLGLSIPFVCQDICALALHRQVDVLNCACDGVNYLLDDTAVRAFLNAAFAALKPGGALLFDISSRHKLERVLQGNTFTDTGHACAYIWRNNYDAGTRLIEMALTCFVHTAGASYDRFDERHIQRAHTQQELCAALEEAGYRDVAVYEAFTMKKPSPAAQRIQFVAIKP